eukprot:GFYU01026066.1.p2 GENE.GFYU01026066.1~~GFYU01026066.1.p2  ORF type:complete len:100 (-),score=21.84 GFYU01026066.1:21-320(-)
MYGSVGSKQESHVAFLEQEWSPETGSNNCVGFVGPDVLSKYGAGWKEPVGRIVWAGSDSSDVWMGYIDGAVRAGWKAAETVGSKLSPAAGRASDDATIE